MRRSITGSSLWAATMTVTAGMLVARAHRSRPHDRERAHGERIRRVRPDERGERDPEDHDDDRHFAPILPQQTVDLRAVEADPSPHAGSTRRSTDSAGRRRGGRSPRRASRARPRTARARTVRRRAGRSGSRTAADSEADEAAPVERADEPRRCAPCPRTCASTQLLFSRSPDDRRADSGERRASATATTTRLSAISDLMQELPVADEGDLPVGLGDDVRAPAPTHLLEVVARRRMRRGSPRRAAPACPAARRCRSRRRSTTRAVSLSASAATITGRPAARMPYSRLGTT